MKDNWVIVVQGSSYHDGSHKHNKNFYDAIVYKDMTKDEVVEIAKKEYKNARCYWQVKTYDEALAEYEKEIYVDAKTKEFIWGQFLDIQEAIKFCKQGTAMVGYKTENQVMVYNKNSFPDKIDIDIILNAKWRTVYKAEGLI